MKFEVEISEDTYKNFQNALTFNGEIDTNRVISRLLNEYSTDAFNNQIGMGVYNPNRFRYRYGKANKRIPRWASRTDGAPYKIIRAFLLLEKDGYTTVDKIKTMCCYNDMYPELRISDVRTFTNDFYSLQYDSGKSLGKVFDVKGKNRVYIWDEVASTMEEYKQDFLKNI